VTNSTASRFPVESLDPLGQGHERQAFPGCRIAIIAGGVLCSVATLFTWVSSGDAAPQLNRSVFELGRHFGVTLLGPMMIVVGLVIAGLGLAIGRITSWQSRLATWIVLMAQLTVIATSVSWGHLRDLVNATTVASPLANAAIGIGYWIACLGAGTALVFGVVLRVKVGQVIQRSSMQ
jgi:hypothetical protein